jgi:hypothetical protein
MKKMIWALILVLILDIFAIYHAMHNADPKRQQLALEMAKLSTQALLVVFGAGVLVQEFNRRRERKAAQNAFRKAIYTRLVRAYTNTKKSRRILRARCCQLKTYATSNVEQRGVRRSAYKAQLVSVNDTQLELEILLHEVRTFSSHFKDHEPLEKGIADMEKYLSAIISEYEKASDIDAVDGCLPLSELPELEDFLKPASEQTGPTEFRKHFGEPFRAATTVLQLERLNA